MTKTLAAVLVAMACGGLVSAAQAQSAYAAKDVNLRAGPARDYPVVAVVAGGASLAVQGCLSDYSWCDVIAGPYRGWVYAGNIDYAYDGQYVPLLGYGPELGIAIVGFVLFDYWSRYYVNRPFYRDRERWEHRAPPRPRARREPPILPAPAQPAPRPAAPGWTPPAVRQPPAREAPQRQPPAWQPPARQAPQPQTPAWQPPPRQPTPRQPPAWQPPPRQSPARQPSMGAPPVPQQPGGPRSPAAAGHAPGRDAGRPPQAPGREAGPRGPHRAEPTPRDDAGR